MEQTSGDCISSVLRFDLSMGEEQWQTDKDKRQLAENELNKVAADAWSRCPMHQRLGNSTVTLSMGDSGGAGGDFPQRPYATMPVDFASFGQEGQVRIAGQPDMQRLGFRSTHIVKSLLATQQQVSAQPLFCCLDSMSVDSPKIPRLLAWPLLPPGVQVDLDLTSYVRTTPLMLDFPRAPAIALGAVPGDVTNGAHRIRVTFERALDPITGSGSEGGFPSDTVTVTNKTVRGTIELSDLPISPIRDIPFRAIWMTKIDDPDTFYLATVIGNYESVLTINLSDGDLGAAIVREADTALTGTERFPVDFHQSVLQDGLACRMAGKVGDMRAPQFWQRWESDVRRMWSEQAQLRNEIQAPPRFGGGRMGGFNRNRFRGVMS